MNATEKMIKNKLEKRGCIAMHSGYPDFLVVHPSGSICFIEVKTGEDKVRKNQKAMHEALKKASIPVYVWKTPDDDDKYEKNGIEFVDRELLKFINYELMRDWMLRLDETLKAALDIQRVLWKVFHCQDAKLKMDGFSRYERERIFNWKLMWENCEKIFRADAQFLYQQLENLCKAHLDEVKSGR